MVIEKRVIRQAHCENDENGNLNKSEVNYTKFYSIYNNHIKHNWTSQNIIFQIDIYLHNKKNSGIIDTGADVSIIHAKNVPHYVNISPIISDLIIKSANGTPMSICVSVKTINTIKENSYEFNTCVIDKETTTSMLGRNFIEKNMEILYAICNNEKQSKAIYTIDKTETSD
ncbi:hypothetical protein COBT_003599 [Conglomerata obtusa]